MAAQNPPGFLQNAGATHTAAQLRMYLASLQAGMSGGATSLRARGGVHPGLGQELLVTQTGSPSMAVLLEPGVASVPGSLSGTQGNYFVVNDAQATLSVTAAHATLPRIDIVVANVRDAFYSGSSNDCQLQVIAGTPASSPVAPTPPDNSITVAEIAVGAAVSTIVNANITDKRFYVAATGGVIRARNEAARPASTEIYESQLTWADDLDNLYVWDGAKYVPIYDAESSEEVSTTSGFLTIAAGVHSVLTSKTFTAISGMKYIAYFESSYRFSVAGSAIFYIRHASGGSITTSSTSVGQREVATQANGTPIAVSRTFVATASGTYTFGATANFYSGSGNLFVDASSNSDMYLRVNPAW